jgi:hypothetical protein
VVVAGVFSVTGASIGDAGRVILGTIGNVLVVPVEALVAGILFFDLGGGRGTASTTKPPPKGRKSRSLPASGA